MLLAPETPRSAVVHSPGGQPSLRIFVGAGEISPGVTWTDLGTGAWAYTYTTPASPGLGVTELIVAFDGTATSRNYQTVAFVDAVPVDNAGITSAVLAGVSSSRITYTGPVAANGNLTLYQGTDYTGDNAITLTVSNWTGPNVNGAAARFVLVDHESYHGTNTATPALVLSGASVAVAQSDTTLTITLAIDAADLAPLDTFPPSSRPTHQYQIAAEYAAGKWVVLADAELTIRRAKPVA